MSIPGINQPLIVVGDTDGLIAILHEEDANHKKAVETVVRLLQPELAAKTIERITDGKLSIENVDIDMLKEALKLFDPRSSKKNTLFDALVVATAKKLGTTVIFSTDDWYSKLGFTLAVDLFKDDRDFA